MPSFPCLSPACDGYAVSRNGFCPECEAQGKVSGPSYRGAYYDQHLRDPYARAFYNSARWLRARGIKLRETPVCERCQKVFANTVHHIKPLRDCSPAERIDQKNLFSACGPCHSIIEAELKNTK